MSFIHCGAQRIFMTVVSALTCVFVSNELYGQAVSESKPVPAQDSRDGTLRTLQDYFPMKAPRDLKDWTERREEIQRRILVCNGLWPLPDRTPLCPIVHGTVDRGDYTVSRVMIQSLPGFYVTGNLYLPKGIDPEAKEFSRKIPGVLCPYGHWTNGRFYEAPEKSFQENLAEGDELFASCGKYPVQARCVTLARMGCAVFFYDMIGYADSIQFDHHRPGVRPHMCTKEHWGFFSPQAELRLQNMMGLQTWSSIRVLDWLESLPYIDRARIGVTGCSGGGTQTFILGAIDSRPAVTLPAVMVSTAMQGGCTCENATYLRIDSGNIDIAACRAPKPMGLTAANDWTVDMELKGFPDIKRVYDFYGKGSDVALFPHLQFGHNYNFISRSEMYRWMNRYLKLGFDEAAQINYGVEKRKRKTASGEDVFEDIPIRSFEKEFKPLSEQEATVWTGKYSRPSGDAAGEAFELALTAWLDADSTKKIQQCQPQRGDPSSMKKFREIVGGGWQVLIGRCLDASGQKKEPAVNRVNDPKRQTDDGQYLTQYGHFENKLHGERVPFVFFARKGVSSKDLKRTAIVTTSKGKAGVFDENGKLKPEFVRLLDAANVIAIDLFGQGESLFEGKELVNAPLGGYGKKNQPWQLALCYTYGYNHPLFSKRVHDIMTAVSSLRGSSLGKNPQSELVLLALDGTGKYGAAAVFACGNVLNRCVLDTRGFRFADINRLDDPDMVPGAVKYGDLPALLTLGAPCKMLLFEPGFADKAFSSVRIAYDATGKASGTLTVSAEKELAKQWNAIMAWLR